MTSAKQWSDNSTGIEPGHPAHVRVIRDIQMEAFKAGMTRAAAIADQCMMRTNIAAAAGGILAVSHSIQEIRDSLKPEDMK